MGLVACAGASTTPPPRLPVLDPSVAWIHSDKLDPDAQEFTLRTFDDDTPFPFVVTLADAPSPADADRLGLELAAEGPARCRRRVRDLAALLADPRVRAVACDTADVAPPSSDAWRAKVDDDIRTVIGARSRCWTPVVIAFGRDAGETERQALLGAGVVLLALDARTAYGFAPVRAIPSLADWPVVSAIGRR